MTFSGFTSLWTVPAPWRTASASQSCTPMRRTCSSVSGPASSRKDRESPRMYSSRAGGCAALYPRDRRDAVILFGLTRGMSLAEVNDRLFRAGEETLF